MSFTQLKNQLEGQIRSLEKNLNNIEINKKSVDMISQQLVSVTSKIGTDLESTFGGFKALTASLDDVIENFDESKLIQLTNQLNIAQLTDQIPLVKDQLIPALGEAASDLEKITGSADAIKEQLLDVVIALPHPEAIAATVKELTAANKEVLESIVKDTIDLQEPLQQAAADFEHAVSSNLPNMEKQLSKAIGEVTGIAENLKSIKIDIPNQIFQDVNNALRKIDVGFLSISENIVEDLLSPVSTALKSISIIDGIKIDIPNSTIQEIISLVQYGRIDTATKILQKFSDLPGEDILNTVKGIVDSNKLSSVTKQLTDTITIKTNDIAVIKNLWAGVNTISDAFAIIPTKEELEADLLSATREITELIIHHTFTGINQNLSAGDINDYSKDIYSDGIPYHYIITRNGNIQRGRPIDKESIALINNHQQYSIQVGLVGGINAPIGSRNMPDVEKWLDKKSFTREQWKSLDIMLRTIYSLFPGLQVMGHSTIDKAQLDPGFDVVEYVASKYGKKLLFFEPSNQPPLSLDELVKRIGPQ